MADFYPLNTPYRPKIPFWTVQQRDCFDRSFNNVNHAILLEPRTGKSKIVVDTCCYHFHAPNDPLHVTGAFISAYPNGAHEGWVRDAFPESFSGPWKGFAWNTDDAFTKKNRKLFDELCAFSGFSLLTVGADTLISERFREDLGKFLQARKSILLAADESSFMIEAKSQRSQIMHRVSHGPGRPFVKLRRILDGTPCDQAGPLDFYNQMGFLDFNILGYANEVEFRNHYAEIETKGRGVFWAKVRGLIEEEVRKYIEPREAKANPLADKESLKEIVNREVSKAVNAAMRDEGKQVFVEKAKRSKLTENGETRFAKRGRDWWTVIKEDSEKRPKFKNMDEFWSRMDGYSDRKTFAECFPNAPRPSHMATEFDLTEKQREVYDKLEKDFNVEIDGDEVDVSHRLSRILRLQQIGSNYWPERDVIDLHKGCFGLGCEACDNTGIVESTKPLKIIDEHNQRLNALVLHLGQVPTIVWARFHQDIDQCVGLCERMKLKVCQYDGRISRKAKLENREGFQSGLFDVMVANQAAASRAIPLWRARRHVVYSNVFGFRTRKQMEERSEHGRKTESTEIIDLVARDTVDDQMILPALRMGMDVSTYVNRDPRVEWL